MFDAVLIGLLIGIGLSVLAVLYSAFSVLRWNVREYPEVMLACVSDPTSPAKKLIVALCILTVLISVMVWGIQQGGVVGSAVKWGLVIHFGTVTLYRVLWAFIETGLHPTLWPAFWKSKLVKGSAHKLADSRIITLIMVISVVMTTIIARQGGYN